LQSVETLKFCVKSDHLIILLFEHPRHPIAILASYIVKPIARSTLRVRVSSSAEFGSVTSTRHYSGKPLLRHCIAIVISYRERTPRASAKWMSWSEDSSRSSMAFIEKNDDFGVSDSAVLYTTDRPIRVSLVHSFIHSFIRPFTPSFTSHHR